MKKLLFFLSLLVLNSCKALDLTDPKDRRAIELLEELTHRQCPFKNIPKPVAELSILECRKLIDRTVYYCAYLEAHLPRQGHKSYLYTPRIARIMDKLEKDLSDHHRQLYQMQGLEEPARDELLIEKIGCFLGGVNPRTWQEWCELNDLTLDLSKAT
jgi:hypothetical protein